MKEYVLIALGELLSKGIDENNILETFKKFSCQRESDLEDFLIHKAITYEKSNFGKTFLFIDKEKLDQGDFCIMAYFTTAQSTLDISTLNSTRRRKVLGEYPGRDTLSSIPAFLIGQLGRNDAYSSEELSGEQILNECYSTLSIASQIVGGKFIVLECREQMYPRFYQSKGFKKLYSELNQNGLYTLMKKINFTEYWNRFSN